MYGRQEKVTFKSSYFTVYTSLFTLLTSHFIVPTSHVRLYFFCGSLMFLFCLVFAMSLCASIYYLCFAGKGLTSCLSFVVSNCEFVTFPIGILGQVWYLIVSILDLCTLTYFSYFTLYQTYQNKNTQHVNQ